MLGKLFIRSKPVWSCYVYTLFVDKCQMTIFHFCLFSVQCRRCRVILSTIQCHPIRHVSSHLALLTPVWFQVSMLLHSIFYGNKYFITLLENLTGIWTYTVISKRFTKVLPVFTFFFNNFVILKISTKLLFLIF